MSQSFAGREDLTLKARLAAELPRILNWAITGWKRLRARGHFVQPPSGQPLVDELTELYSARSGLAQIVVGCALA